MKLINVASLRTPHGFFTREGGVSQGGYSGLNCVLSTGDERANVEANRGLAMRSLGLTIENLAMVRQVHSERVVVVGEEWAPGEPVEADALVTDRPGIALGVLGADCAPVLFFDEQAGVIGAAHAGWRGALTGVTDSTVAAMAELGADPARIVAVIGPCIAKGSYEVGAEFPAPFLDADPGNAIFFSPAERAGHHYFDLPGYLERRLSTLGTVIRTDLDTVADEQRFFSHRRSQLRGEAQCGRQLSAILL